MKRIRLVSTMSGDIEEVLTSPHFSRSEYGYRGEGKAESVSMRASELARSLLLTIRQRCDDDRRRTMVEDDRTTGGG